MVTSKKKNDRIGGPPKPEKYEKIKSLNKRDISCLTGEYGPFMKYFTFPYTPKG